MITIISGIPGSGKSLYLTHLIYSCITNDSLQAYFNLKREIEKFRAGGMNFELPEQRHLVYSDYSVKINNRIKTYDIDGYEIGLPNPFFKTRLIPPYSTIFLDEAQRYYDSRLSFLLREEVYRWYQLHRHNDYNIFMTCQRIGNIDVNIRALAETCIVIDELILKKDDFGRITKIHWKMRKFYSCETAEKYQLAREENKKLDIGEKFEIKTEVPVGTFYNTKAHRPVFYNGKYNEGFDYFTSDGYLFTLKSFVEYNNNHIFSAPVGFLKNQKYDEKILNKGGFIK